MQKLHSHAGGAARSEEQPGGFSFFDACCGPIALNEVVALNPWQAIMQNHSHLVSQENVLAACATLHCAITLRF